MPAKQWFGMSRRKAEEIEGARSNELWRQRLSLNGLKRALTKGPTKPRNQTTITHLATEAEQLLPVPKPGTFLSIDSVKRAASRASSFYTANSNRGSIESYRSARDVVEIKQSHQPLAISELESVSEMPSDSNYMRSAGPNNYGGYRSLSPLPIAELDESVIQPITRSGSEYYRLLQDKDLILPADQELNWSGEGQHVEYGPEDSVPLVIVSHLGSSLQASVDKVRCRRILLARKTMRCRGRLTLANALVEVEHLNRLRHPHIVQLIGTYLQKREFSLLLYPAADCHLGTFLDDIDDLKSNTSSPSSLSDLNDRKDSVAAGIICLANALAYVHQNTTKHMDIKPANILVKRAPPAIWQRPYPVYRFYLADFGISRSFQSQDHSETEGPIARTPKYCAPEVYDLDKRGRSADVFSLGCVFLEMLTIYLGESIEEFTDFRRGKGSDSSFRLNMENVLDWQFRLIRGLKSEQLHVKTVLAIIMDMMKLEAHRRLSAQSVVSLFEGITTHPFMSRGCCEGQPEPYVVEDSSVS